MISSYAAFHWSYNVHEPWRVVHNYCSSRVGEVQ